MTFKDFLISKNIKFVEMDDEDVLVDEYTLIPFLRLGTTDWYFLMISSTFIRPSFFN